MVANLQPRTLTHLPRILNRIGAWPWFVVCPLLLAFVLVSFADGTASAADARLYFFTAPNCPHCAEVRPHLEEIAAEYPGLNVVEQDIWGDQEAFDRLLALLETHGDQPVTTPTLFLGNRFWIGLQAETLPEIKTAIRQCLEQGCPDAMTRLTSLPSSPPPEEDTSVALPLLGTFDAREASLPLVTVVLGLVDSVNPCAFFVLLFLLSLMVHAHSHARMLTVGVVFVSCSGLVYFLFMAAWLNLFLATDGMRYITLLAGLVALVVGGINIKDFVRFRQGVSLTMSDQSKSRLYQRSRQLVQASSYPALLGGTILLALAANSYELLCTAGFPMVYTRILTLNELTSWQYYGYLGFYNLVYILPLLAIVVVFALTLGAHKLTEREGRALKLVSGVMMVALGGVLVAAPGLLYSVVGTIGLLVGSLLISGGVIWVDYRCRQTS